MKVVEHMVQSKNSDVSSCEDGISITSCGVAVIDGATSSSATVGGKRSGRIAMELLRDSFPRLVNEPDPFHLLELLNEPLRIYRARYASELGDSDWAPRASIVLYQERYRRIVSYGDCQYMINGKTYSHVKLIDRVNADKRVGVLKNALQNGASVIDLLHNDIGRASIEQSLRDQHAFENTTGIYGYPVMNGDELLQNKMIVQSVRRGDEVVLASDGYPTLGPTLAISESSLAQVLKDDPLCIFDNPQTKGISPGNLSFDDRSYVRLVVGD